MASKNTVSFKQPSGIWCQVQSLKGTGSKHISEKEVPGTDLTGKWIIISGANNGIGREATLSFSKWGANIILACREPPAWESHPNVVVDECKLIAKENGHVSDIEWWPIDMADLSSVEAFAQKWLETGRPIDILCNNAGTGMAAGPGKLRTKDGYEVIHQVNFLSHVLLTLHLLPALAKSQMPRIVCTTSCFHYLGKFDLDHFNNEEGMIGDPYGNNKLYFQMWVAEMQHRLLQHREYQHITINGIHPGYVNTNIWTSGKTQAEKSFVEKFIVWLTSKLGINSQQGSLAITNAATNPQCGPNPTIQGVGPAIGQGGGRYFNRIWPAEPMPHCADFDTRQKLWLELNDTLKLKEKGLLDVLGVERT